jgi:hypothetical protein
VVLIAIPRTSNNSRSRNFHENGKIHLPTDNKRLKWKKQIEAMHLPSFKHDADETIQDREKVSAGDRKLRQLCSCIWHQQTLIKRESKLF